MKIDHSKLIEKGREREGDYHAKNCNLKSRVKGGQRGPACAFRDFFNLKNSKP